MDFGSIVRQLRRSQGIGLKTLAPELGVSPGYLSKLENELVRPSPEMVSRVATYFDYSEDDLFRAAERLPPDVLDILRSHPEEAVDLLRRRFGDDTTGRAGGQPT
jgi:transcriptional regulator with XRE-family HTH domain